jgi:hypothetical protein
LLRGALAVTEFVNADDIAHGLSAFRNDAGEPELRALAANPAGPGLPRAYYVPEPAKRGLGRGARR